MYCALIVAAMRTREPMKTRRRRKSNKNKLTPKALLESSNSEMKNVVIEYVTEPIISPSDPAYNEFSKIFAHFLPETDQADNEFETEEAPMEVDEEEEEPVISNRKLKKMNRMTISQLKQQIRHPEVVEPEDVSAKDPKLLIFLKSVRNSVPVPGHWSTKRKYLTGKRGYVKPPFDLPAFIKDTGIMELRDTTNDKESRLRLKAKVRGKLQPRLGKVTVDYERLYDAFFRHQTKPRLTLNGDLYFEGKEFESQLKDKKPGTLSEELKMALGMPIGAPPPWLVNMQRYGPPPSYPQLKLPGLNCPIPEGAKWGYHSGGWGKPPVDENNQPLFGDVFGEVESMPQEPNEPIDNSLWGEVEIEEELEPMYDENENKPAPPEEEPETHEIIPEIIEEPEFITELEAPESIELRKPKKLYQVLEQKPTSISGIVGSQHTYDIQTLDPTELETLNEEETITETLALPQRPAIKHPEEDLSQLVVQHAIKAEKKKKSKKDSFKF